MKLITRFVNRHTSQLVDINQAKFRLPSRYIIWIVLFISYSVLLQGIGDVVIKVLTLFPWFPEIPISVDFLFLTAISVLMGYQALIGLRRREIDVTRNSLALGILVECGLIVSDIINVVEALDVYAAVLWVRLPFIILTIVNFILLVYVSRSLRIFRGKNGKFRLV